MLKLIILIGLLIAPFTTIFADDIYQHPLNDTNNAAFKQVQAQLAKPAVLTGNFEQTRRMQLLSQPLSSSGTFMLSKTQGLVWEQTQPFSSKMLVNANKIEQTIMNNPPMVITKKEQPVVFAFTSVFLSVFRGDTSQIEDIFSIYFEGNKQHWQIALRPKSAPFNQAIVNIEIEGGQYIDMITVHETQDNTMLIKFSHQIAKA